MWTDTSTFLPIVYRDKMVIPVVDTSVICRDATSFLVGMYSNCYFRPALCVSHKSIKTNKHMLYTTHTQLWDLLCYVIFYTILKIVINCVCFSVWGQSWPCHRKHEEVIEQLLEVCSPSILWYLGYNSCHQSFAQGLLLLNHQYQPYCILLLKEPLSLERLIFHYVCM